MKKLLLLLFTAAIALAQPSGPTGPTGNYLTRVNPVFSGVLRSSDTSGTSSGGLKFGTDTNLWRSGAGGLALNGASESILRLYVGGTQKAYFYTTGSQTDVFSASGPLVLSSNSNTAVTLDASQTQTNTSEIRTTGAAASFLASSAGMQFYSGGAIFTSTGANASTNGTITLRSQRSDGSNSKDVTISGAGALTTASDLTSGGNIFSGGDVRAAATGYLYFNGRSTIKSTANGSISFRNNADNAYSDITANDVGGSTFYASNSFSAGNDGAFYFSTRSSIRSSSDGTLQFRNNANNADAAITAGTGTFSGALTVPGAGLNSERFGSGATAAGSDAVAVGKGATASGSSSVVVGGAGASAANQFAIAVGYNSQANKDNGIAIGTSANAPYYGVAVGHSASGVDGNYSTVIGGGASSAAAAGVVIGATATVPTTHTGSMVIGHGLTSTAKYQAVLGSGYDDGTGYGIGDWYFGNGVTAAVPKATVTFQPTGGSGTNVAGANFVLAAGKATGNAASGKVYIKTSVAGASGTTLQSLQNSVTIETASSENVFTLHKQATTGVGVKLSGSGQMEFSNGFVMTENGTGAVVYSTGTGVPLRVAANGTTTGDATRTIFAVVPESWSENDYYLAVMGNGTVKSSGGRVVKVNTDADDRTVSIGEHSLVYTGTGGHTFTLPTIASAATGQMYYIKNRGSGNLSVASGTGSQIYTSSAQASITLAAGDAVTLISDGTYFNVN